MYYGSIIDAITRATMAEGGDPNLLSQQAGQDRRQWLTDKEKIIDDWLKQRLGPGLYEGTLDALKLGGFVSQGEDIGDAIFHSREMLDADNWMERIQHGLMMALLTGAAFVPGSQASIVRGIDEGGDLVRRALADTSGGYVRGADEVADFFRKGSDEIGGAVGRGTDDVVDLLRRGSDDFGDAAQRFMADETGGFGGLRAKDVDLDALAVAKRRAAFGVAPDEIWFETGWMFDTDGFWKMEIDDSGFRLTDWAQETMMETGSVSGKADDIFVMDNLGRSYPQLREVGVELQGGPSGHGGFGVFDETGQPVPYGSDAAKIGTRKMYVIAPDEGSALHVAVHELSGHGIQDIEGFAAGGSPEKYIGVTRRANPDWDVWDANRELAAEGQAIVDSTDFKVAKIEARRYVDDDLGPYFQEQMDAAIADGLPHEELIRLDGELQQEMDRMVLDKYPIMRELRAIEEVTPLIEPPLRIPTDRAYFEGAGEVSARNVQTRGRMPEDVRRTIPPQHTVDVDPAVQSIDFDKGPPTLTQHIPDDHPLSPSQTAFATYESVPGQTTGHLSGAADADEFTRKVFTDDPLNSWMIPERTPSVPNQQSLLEPYRGTDALYAGQRGELGFGTGHGGDPNTLPYIPSPYGSSSAPTTEMQGIFQPDPMVPAQLNPGHVARPYTRPLFDGEPDLLHTLAQQDEISRLTGTEAVRGYIDAQDMSAWHNPLLDPAPGDANAMWLQGTSERPLTVEEIVKANVTGIKHGLPNVVDTGQGLTMTDFADPHRVTAQDAYDIGQRVDRMDAFVTAEPANVVSGYTDYSDAWKAGEGSGQATQQLLDVLDETPANIVRALDNNPYLAQIAKNKIELAEQWAPEWGATRADLMNALEIFSEGPGWIGRLREGLKSGAILPAVGIVMLAVGHEALNQPDRPYYGIQ